MRALSRLWTGAVAYISLLAAAGVSMAGNLADTYRTRAGDVDGLDKILAIVWPLFVILAIEMFVSPRWAKTTMFQVWRWTGCLAIGGLAMMASWTHLHDLLASRGQLAIVAKGGPLAIDGMAIMATGLILSTRGQLASLANVQVPDSSLAKVGQDGPATMASHVAELDNAMANPDSMAIGLDVLASQPDDPTVDIQAELVRWQQGYQEAITDQGVLLAQETETFLAKAIGPEPVMTDTIKPEAADLIKRMMALNAKAGEIDRAVSDMCDVSTRQARRWRSALRNEEN